LARVVLLDLVVFLSAFLWALAFLLLVYRVILRLGPPRGGGGGLPTPRPSRGPEHGGSTAGPDDLARSA